jgi:hypothetical protein
MKRATPDDAYDALVQAKELIENFKAGSFVTAEIVNAHIDEEVDIRMTSSVVRMTMCWIVICLAKLVEFWQRYGALASEDVRADMKRVLAVIRERRIEDFRNQIAAHMFDKGTLNPVPQNEITDHLCRVWGGQNVEHFLLWLEDPDKKDQGTVCAVLRRLRRHLRDSYTIVEPDYVKDADRLLLPADEDD